MGLLRGWVLPLALLLLAGSHAVGADAGVRKLRAGVFVNPPFIMDKGEGRYGGMAVELWEEVAKELDILTEYVPFHNVDAMMEAARDGRIDIIVDNMSVTHERAQFLKFSYPWYDSGLLILVNTEAQGSLWSALRKYQNFRVYIALFAIFLLMAVVMTLIRRRREPDFPQDWKTGLALCFYNVMDSAISGKISQRYLGWAGNLLFVAWVFFGVGAVAYVTSTMTSAMTSMKLAGDIATEGDLPGKRIGVITGTTAEDYFDARQMPVETFNEFEEAVSALLRSDLDAVVMDAVSLGYYVLKNPDLPLAVVGELFHPDKYSFAAGYVNAGLVDEVTVELIRMRESGRIDAIEEEYINKEQEEEALPWPSE